jgi:hypothetical protein
MIRDPKNAQNTRLETQPDSDRIVPNPIRDPINFYSQTYPFRSVQNLNPTLPIQLSPLQYVILHIVIKLTEGFSFDEQTPMTKKEKGGQMYQTISKQLSEKSINDGWKSKSSSEKGAKRRGMLPDRREDRMFGGEE